MAQNNQMTLDSLVCPPDEQKAPLWRTLKRTAAACAAVGLLSGCSFHFSAGTKTAGDASSKSGGSASSSAQAKSTSSASAKASAKASGKAEGSAKKKSSETASASLKASSKKKGKASAGASMSGEAQAAAGSKASGSAKTTGKAKASGGAAVAATHSDQKSSSSSSQASASASASANVIFKSKGRTSGVARAKKKDSFHAVFLVRGGIKGSASGSASVKGGTATAKGKTSVSVKGKDDANQSSSNGKSSGSVKVGGTGTIKIGSSKKKDPKKDTSKQPTKEKPQKEPAKTEKPKQDSKQPTKTPPADKPKEQPPTPAQPEPETPSEVVVIDPPDEPSDNVFGYEEPVRGCFEGIVYPLQEDAAKLPTNWGALSGVSVVYACEWDIPTRAWETGFPGVGELFEWFAIRYSGSFAVQTAGEWKFRISSDDGAKLYIDGKLVIDNDGQHAPAEKTGTIQLSKGDHDMVLEYFQGPRYHINLQLYATPPGGNEGIFSVR